MTTNADGLKISILAVRYAGLWRCGILPTGMCLEGIWAGSTRYLWLFLAVNCSRKVSSIYMEETLETVHSKSCDHIYEYIVTAYHRSSIGKPVALTRSEEIRSSLEDRMPIIVACKMPGAAWHQ